MIDKIWFRLNLLNRPFDQRSKNIFKNITLSFGTKLGSTIVNLMLIPLTINYINQTEYGIWLTISSITSWLNLFDIGMGNGLRNKISHNVALKNYDEAKNYVSSTYAILILLSIVILIGFSFLNPLISWGKWLNISNHSFVELNKIMFLLVLSFSIQFVVQLINTVLLACHKASITGLITLIGQVLTYLMIVILKTNRPGTLLNLLITMSSSPIIVMLIASLYLYNTSLNNISPSLKNIKWTYSKEILSTSSSFFIIQIGALILFQTSNFIIARVQGPTAVTEYNIAYRLFSLYIMGFTIIITPFWSAFSDAYTKGDLKWMESSVIKMRKFWFLISIIIVPSLVIFSNKIYKYWIGANVNISADLTLTVAIYSICYTGMSISCYFLNGISKIKLQKWMYVGVCIFNIPLSFFLGKLIGAKGVVISNTISIFLIMSILWIQTNKIIHKKDYGIWSK